MTPNVQSPNTLSVAHPPGAYFQNWCLWMPERNANEALGYTPGYPIAHTPRSRVMGTSKIAAEIIMPGISTPGFWYQARRFGV
jgi:hypothetical protein